MFQMEAARMSSEFNFFTPPLTHFTPHGADGGGRTHTTLRLPDFESSASANSATSALVGG